MHGRICIGDDSAVDFHDDVASRLQNVDAFERVLGMYENGSGFFEPLIHAGEVDFDESLER